MTRIADRDDLPFLEHLEESCFPPRRRSTRRSLRMSITSPAQVVMIQEAANSEGEPVDIGAAILLRYRSSLRIYSLAVLPEYRGSGAGRELIENIFKFANENSYYRLFLEADSTNEKLVQWYQRCGFEVVETLPDYYGPNEPAVRMRTDLPRPETPLNLIVVDKVKDWPFEIPGTEVVAAKAYLDSATYQNSTLVRVFNLCRSFKPHKFGYYVSLLASARDQRVIPNVTSLRDLSSTTLVQSVAEDLEKLIQKHLVNVSADEFVLDVYFEQSPQREFQALAKLMAQQFDLLLFRVHFSRQKTWEVRHVQSLSLGTALKSHKEAVCEFAEKFFQKKRFRRARFKSYQYDLAILINAQEHTPPSCPLALEKMREAGEECGIYTEFITPGDYDRICEFDALFIRETTSVANHTYRFSRRAYAEGLIVIDDPWSILRCSNKMYLYERLARSRIRQPRSKLLCKNGTFDASRFEMPFPLILKLPDGSFSTGVFKVSSAEQMQERLGQLFADSEVVIAQEFMQTPFDWRIGILDSAPLFACKYHMARGHWQIYNWASDSKESVEGDSETLPLDKVPAHVLRTAVKGAALIGDGLYGVDLKEYQGKAYIIEINDNPNIDAGTEDATAGENLYTTLMNSFIHRIERERNVPQMVWFRED